MNSEKPDTESDAPATPPESSPEPSPERPPEKQAEPSSEGPPEKQAEPSSEGPPEKQAEPSSEGPPKPPPEDAVTGEPGENGNKPRRGGGALSFLAFIFSLAALAGAGWVWWQDQVMVGQQDQSVSIELARLDSSNSELAQKLKQLSDNMSSLADSDNDAEIKALQGRLEADRRKLDAAESSIREQLELSRSLQAVASSMQGRLAAAEAAVAGMSTLELDASRELDIAEVDYLLRLANERLKLFADPTAADQALEVADMHLAALDNPMYLGVRQDIATARRNLAGVEMPDYLQIANDLDTIQDQVASLPFPGEDPSARLAGQAESEGWWEKLKGVFSGLVTVRRSTGEENQRISLQDKDYIRQRVWLQLEIAHLSLMRRDQDGFTKSLARVEQTLASWFDTADSNYQAIRKSIDGLKALEIQVEMPDITTPWSTLRMLRSGQVRPVAAPQPIEQEVQE